MNENLKQLVTDGLLALKAGGRVTAAANDETLSAVTDPELRSVLTTGSDALREWTARVDRALGEVGATGEGENPIIEAHVRVAKQIRDAAPDDQVRDLGIIAAGQLALHYWTAAFGTLRAYAERLELTQTAQELGRSVDEAKQADDLHTQLAARIMG